jgi:CubicO group peptidase (beta-lactamase class C family)
MFRISLLALMFLSGHLLAAEANFSAAELEQFTQSMQKTIAGRPEFQGTAVLMRGKQILWQYQRGTAAAGQAFDQNTAFFAGSISKILTAMLVMQQVQSGVLDLQAPVNHYLAELKQPWAAEVRVADLLSHSSGLVDINTQQHYGQFRYNNLNFQLLGQILTAVTKRPYADLAKQLLQQCDMHNSGFADLADKVSQGWYEEQGRLKAVSGFMPVAAEPSGGLIASAADLAALPLCMQQQLSSSSLQQMTTPRVLRQHRWGKVHYGYGVQISQTAAGVEWSHGGYIQGYVSVLNYFPAQQLCLVVLENQSLDPVDFARAAYYHDSLRTALIKMLSQNQKG